MDNNILKTLSITGGTPDLRKLNRDLIISYFGHDFGLGLSVKNHGKLYENILNNIDEFPYVNMIFSDINSYLIRESDIFELTGTILTGLEELGIEINNTHNIFNELDEIFKIKEYPESSVNIVSPDFGVSRVFSRKNNISVLQYCIFIAISIFIVSVVRKVKYNESNESTESNVLIVKTKLPVSVDIMTPLWGSDNTLFPPSKEVDKLMEYYVNEDRKKYQTDTTLFFEDENLILNVDPNSNTPNLHKNALEWSKYLIDIVDPVYIWSKNDKPTINLSNKNKVFDEDELSLGFYSVRTNDLLIKERHNEDLEEMTVVNTLVHELAHKVHLDVPDVFLPCSDKGGANQGKLCKNPFRMDRNRTESFKKHISSKFDEAKSVLYLGNKSETMSPDSAKIYMKLNLDLRIEKIYDNSMKSGKYPDDIREYFYSLTDHFEFWAEASTSFIVGNYDHFQSKEWIKINDPALYDLLEEVYSGK